MEQTLQQHIFMKTLLEQYLTIKQEEHNKQKVEMFEKLNATKVSSRLGFRSIYNPTLSMDKLFEEVSSKINDTLTQINKNILKLKEISSTESTLQGLKQEIYSFYIAKLLVKCSSIIEYVATYLFENNKLPFEVTIINENGIDKAKVSNNDLETLSEEDKIYYSMLLPYIKSKSKTKVMS